MARQRSPDRDKAFELWKDSGGELKLKDIAAELGISDSQVRKWKNQDEWEQKLNSNVTNEKSNVTKTGAPFGNKNALNNRGGPGAKKGNNHAQGHGAPKQNSNAVTHGFFRKHFPEDVADLAAEIMEKNPIDMLWENITIQYTAIIRAQRLMFVKDQEDITKEVKKEKSSESSDEIEYEIQFAWDKHATFLNAQSRAMSTLVGLIEKYDKLANTEEQKLRIEKLKKEIASIKVDSDTNQNTEDWKESLMKIAERRRKQKEAEANG